MRRMNSFRPQHNAYKRVLSVPPEKPLRMICRPLAGSGDNSDGQNEETLPGQNNQGDGSGQTKSPSPSPLPSQQKPAVSAGCCCCCCCQNKTSDDNSDQKAESEQEFNKLIADLPRFGPAYGKDAESVKAFKQQAIKHVKPETTSDEIPSEYLSAIREVEEVAMKKYHPSLELKRLKKSDFREMMIIDGCFFLQLALHILGGTNLLGYPKQHIYFGSPIDDKISRRSLEAMFLVGNQIPCDVIRVLMKQSFFQNVIKRGIEKETWQLPSDSLPKMALYLIVVLPEIEEINGKRKGPFSKLTLRQDKIPRFHEPPLDILHALHCLVIGPEHNVAVSTIDIDTRKMVKDIESGTQGNIDESFPSASVLKNSGIILKKAKKGIRGIHFSARSIFLGFLSIPPFTFDRDTELMLQYLKDYEIQQLEKGKHEVTAYIRFMSDLIQKPEDVTILEDKGIIRVNDSVNEDELLEMLARIGSPQEIKYTENLRLTRLQTLSYSRPRWDLVILGLFLTIVQTFFTVLSYAKPPKSS